MGRVWTRRREQIGATRGRRAPLCGSRIGRSRQYERLLTIARGRGTEAYLMVVLGGDAGLRLGEIIALERRDVDLAARRLTVQRSDWLGHVTVPKGGRRSRSWPATRTCRQHSATCT